MANDVTDITRACPVRLVKIASAHSIFNLLAVAVEDPEIAQWLDTDLVAFLREMRMRNQSRNAALTVQLIEACEALQNAGIEPVALKGGIELISPMYPNAADRFLSDLDVLVPQEQIDEAIKALEALGYSSRGATYDRQSIHAPALWNERHPTAIELHTAVSWGRGAVILPAPRVIRRARPADGFPMRVPNVVDRVCHLIVHAQFNSGR